MSPRKKKTGEAAIEKRGRGRPAKPPEEKVRRVVVYLTPASYEALQTRANQFHPDMDDQRALRKYCKRSLENLAEKLIAEAGKK